MADDNNKVLIEIVLDDGSIQKGFAKFTQEAKKASDDTKKEFSTIGDVLNTNLFTEFQNAVKSIPVSFAAIGIAAVAVGALIKEAFDLTLEGERIKSVEVQFNSFTEAAKVSSEELRSGLEKSANGLIDTTDLLKLATSATIELGSAVTRLPEVLEISRRATIALGGSLEERFSAAVTAIETGNTRILRSQGIIIDQEKAYAKFGATIGILGTELSKTHQQQAILNAFIEQAGPKFANATTGVTQNNVAVKQLSVLITELHENFALFVESNFGEFFAKLASNLNGALKALTDKTPLQQATTAAADLKAQIFQLSAEINNLTVKNESLGDGFIDSYRKIGNNAKIDELRAKLIATQLEFDKTAVASQNAAEKIAENGIGTKTAVKASPLDDAETAAAQRRNDEIKKLNDQRIVDQIAYEQALLDQNRGAEEAQELSDDINRQKEIALENEHQQALSAIRAKYIGNDAKTEQLRNDSIYAVDQQFELKKQKLAIDSSNKERAENQARLNGAATFFGALASLSNSSSRELFEIAKVGSIGQAIISTYTAATNAYRDIPYPFNIAASIAIAAAGLANVATISNTNFGDTGGSGGISAPSISSTSAPDVPGLTDSKPADVTRAPQQGLVVNINGDILGDENSGKRLVDLMNSAFDTSGVSLRQGLV